MAGNKVPSVSSVAENCKSDDGRLRKRVTRSRGDEEKREAIYKICVMQGNIGGMEKDNKRRKIVREREIKDNPCSPSHRRLSARCAWLGVGIYQKRMNGQKAKQNTQKG
jgi:hypothetical protein